jgi:hypothetical protein
MQVSPRIHVSFDEKNKTYDRVVTQAATEKRKLSAMAEILIERGLDAVVLTDEEKMVIAAVRSVGGERVLALLREAELAGVGA